MNLTRTRTVFATVLAALLLVGCEKRDFDFESALIFGVATGVLSFLFGFLSVIFAGLIGLVGGAYIAYMLDVHIAIGCVIGALMGLFLGAIAKGFTSKGGIGFLDEIEDVVDFTD